MAKGYLLSQADHDVLRRMIDWYRRSGMDHDPSQEERPISGAPETYVAKVPSGGIPGRTGTQPGVAECELYRIVDGNLDLIGMERDVYNLSTTYIGEEYGTATVEEDTYALVTRTKGGPWVVVTGTGGSGGNRVAYTEEIIYGRDGLTPGGDGEGGPVKVQPLKLDGSPLAFVADGSEVDCYSWVKADSTDPKDEVDDGGKLFIFIEQDSHGIWWFTGQDCPPGADVAEEE